MTAPLRLAGRAPTPERGWITWTVADGRRGRRWRTVTERKGQVVSSALLEVDPDGRFAKLELAVPVGLLTLHPEGDQLHGNAVDRDGVRHLAYAWSPEHSLEIDGLSVAAVITIGRLSTMVPIGEGRTLRSVTVAMDLGVTEGERRFVRVSQRTWRIEGGAETREVSLDERGLPEWGAGAVEWPLDLHPHG